MKDETEKKVAADRVPMRECTGCHRQVLTTAGRIAADRLQCVCRLQRVGDVADRQPSCVQF